MSVSSSIEWTDATWNPIRGCTRISKGCENCYAERLAARFSDPGYWGNGFARRTSGGPRWSGVVAIVQEVLDLPRRWKKPRRVFVNSMSDLFHERVSAQQVDQILARVALRPQHVFQVLTKRPDRMRLYFQDRYQPSRVLRIAHQLCDYYGVSVPSPQPLRNLWLGTSIEDQSAAADRIDPLLQTPAVVRWASVEPLLGPVDLSEALGAIREDGLEWRGCAPRLDWVVVGGESGPEARPCEVSWIRSVVNQCALAGVPVFVKQFGSRPKAWGDELDRWPFASRVRVEDLDRGDAREELSLASRKGGDPAEWPTDLRVREFPEVA